MQIPPELMTPEQREERATELEREISREWLKFAIADAAIIVPFAAVLIVGIVTGAIPESAITPIAILAGFLSAPVVYLIVVRRIHPRQKELQALREG